MTEFYCYLCDKPLKGHSLYFADLGDIGEVFFCEACVRKALIAACREWDEAAEKAEEDYDPWLEEEIEKERKEDEEN